MDIPYTIKIRGSQPSQETIRMQITDVNTNLMVGEDGIITVTLTNPCKTVPFEE